MCRLLIDVLQNIEMSTELASNKNVWLNTQLLLLPDSTLELVQQAIAKGRELLYAAPGCANIQNVDVLYMLGFNTLQYHVKQLVIQTSKGKIHLPSPFGGVFIPRETVWPKAKPIMTVY